MHVAPSPLTYTRSNAPCMFRFFKILALRADVSICQHFPTLAPNLRVDKFSLNTRRLKVDFRDNAGKCLPAQIHIIAGIDSVGCTLYTTLKMFLFEF